MSEKSFDTVVRESSTKLDDDVQLIVKSTSEIYDDPINSLGINKDTKLLNVDGNEMSVNDFKQGNTVTVKFKDTFSEGTLFYYSKIYELKLIDN